MRMYEHMFLCKTGITWYCHSFVCLTQIKMPLGYVIILFMMLLMRMTAFTITIHYYYDHHDGTVVDVDDADDL